VISRILSILAVLVSVCSAQIEVKLKADQPQDVYWARLTISLKNVGATAVQAPRAAFDLAVPSGKIPVVENWYVGSVRVSLEKQQSNGVWRIWFNYDGTLAAGTEWNGGSGAQVGVHLTDGSQWQPWTSPSFDGNTGVFSVNRKIYVWDATGQQIWGPTPPPPVSTKGYSSVTVKISGDGTCNAVGTVVLTDSDRLDLRCMRARASLPAEIWIDGAKHAGTDSATILQDGKDHRVEVRFVPREIVWSNITVTGPGTADPVGNYPVYRGDSLWIISVAQENAKLLRLQIDGTQRTLAQRTLIPDVKTPVSASLEFVAVQPWTSLQVNARREASTDSIFSRFYIQVKNTGSRALATGWTVRIPFRVPSYLTPNLYLFDVPSANASISSLGDGWWMLTVTATQSLPPGAIGGDGRGWFLALRYQQEDRKWDRTGDVAIPSSTTMVQAPYIRVFGNDGNPVAGKEWPMASRRDDHPNLEVKWMDEGMSKDVTRPRILIKNNGPGSLSDFYYDYFFCTENGKQPILDPYYMVAPRITLQALGGFCFKARYDFVGVTLSPGNSVPNNSGNVVGIHYSDWSNWDRSNDWSNIGTAQTLQPNDRIPVYDRWGNRLTGTSWTDPGQPGDRDGNTTIVEGDLEVVYAPPVIVVQPSDVRVDEDSVAVFEIRAAGDGQLKYQWRRNGQDIPGATGTVYRIDRARSEMDGDQYVCQVKSGDSWVLSRQATLRVTRKPLDLVISVQPQDDTASIGAQARFEVYATGASPLKFQWYKGNRPLPGQKASAMAVPFTDVRDTLDPIWVRISDANGRTLDSRSAHIRLKAAGLSLGKMVVKGFFADQSDKSPTDTSVDIVVRLYRNAQGGEPLWSEEHWDLPVVEGGWSLELGTTRGLDSLLRVVATQSTLYLELVLEGGMPRVFSPRLLLTSVPYALQSGVRVVLGSGAPSGTTLEMGTLYFDQSTKKTWFRDASGWRALEP